MTNRLGWFAKIVLHGVLAAGAVTMLAPLVWQVGVSFKPANELQETRWMPRRPTVENYATLLGPDPARTAQCGPTLRRLFQVPVLGPCLDSMFNSLFGPMIVNSVFVAAYTTFLVMLTSTMAGFAFARLQFAGRDKLFLAYLATMMVPGAVTMIPTFVLCNWLGLRNTYMGVILPAAFSVYGTFMMRQFFMGIPTDLEDAARMDGCGSLRIYWHIVLPLSKPAVATLATLTFIGSWNSLLWPALMLDSRRMLTLPVGLTMFQDSTRTMMSDWGALMAAATIVMLPIIVIFLFNQQYFVRGLRMGAIKG